MRLEDNERFVADVERHVAEQFSVVERARRAAGL